jgi:8-oxo-dGTP diphosphatase
VRLEVYEHHVSFDGVPASSTSQAVVDALSKTRGVLVMPIATLPLIASTRRRPQVGVGVLVLQDGQVLLGKRKGAHGAGTWSAPGGHLEFGEAIEVCASREVLEETNLVIKNPRLGPFTNTVFEAERKHYVTVFVIAAPASGLLTNREPQKCEGWAWFPWSNLPEPLFAPLVALRNQGFVLE